MFAFEEEWGGGGIQLMAQELFDLYRKIIILSEKQQCILKTSFSFC